MTRVLLALPYVSKDGFAGPCVSSLLKNEGEISNVFFIGDTSQVHARNRSCEEAIRVGAHYIWFVDSDQDFPPDALEKLKAADADVACADMWARGWPSFRLVFRAGPKDAKGMIKHVSVDDETAARGQIEDVTFCGMGCTLIKTEILYKIKERFPNQPWFWTAEHGEDATFCFNVLEVGGSVKCNFGLKSGHWGHIRMMGQDFTRVAQ
jgi:hypothetical protein